MNVAAASSKEDIRPDGSQVKSFLDDLNENMTELQGTDPRVGWRTTNHPGTPSGVKLAGRGETLQSNSLSRARKHSCRRACHRAAQTGYTWYRGHVGHSADLNAACALSAESDDTELWRNVCKFL